MATDVQGEQIGYKKEEPEPREWGTSHPRAKTQPGDQGTGQADSHRERRSYE